VPQYTVIATCKGAALNLIRFQHPLAHMDAGYNRFSPVYLGEYVELGTGTGIVHSAPAYGVEDFQSCKSHGMHDDEILNPVQGNGVYANWLPFFGGEHIWKANPLIVDKLRDAGTLLHSEKFSHSYMHCWRHKTPIIYRATSQWFAGMDIKPNDGKSSLRETALAAIEQTQFFPGWGKSRLYNMIAGRPDWTLSRQRQWGVPMAFLVHKETGLWHPRTTELLELIAQAVEKGGIEAWQSLDAKDLLTRIGCAADADAYVKNKDTIDVWFDSGTTHYHVMRGSHPHAHHWPADLYLEGSDQHRGWFHSSLLTGCMLDGRAPYNALLTHGFTVDGEGRKMSKSLGNGVEPKEVFNKLGAEILRLWVASTDYSGDLSINDEILKRVVEVYRRIRNTLKFLLANISDFDITKHAVAVEEMVEIDRYALAITEEIDAEIRASYEKYEFHPVVAKLQNFCAEELGAFYLDILKDRLYTTKADSRARRSAQTALWHITRWLLTTMAPILSFTAEEAWAIFEPSKLTVFEDLTHRLRSGNTVTAVSVRWIQVRELRAVINKDIEDLRSAGKVGSSLQAEVTIKTNPVLKELLDAFGEDLKFVFIVSRVEVLLHDGDETIVEARPSAHAKCERCWHYRDDVGHDPSHPGICGRCTSNLFGEGEARSFA
jgi:isoleucyl-tRNA synthetase